MSAFHAADPQLSINSVSCLNPWLIPSSILGRKSSISCIRNTDDYHATLKALKSKDCRPKKFLGQYYMLSSAINDRLVAAADVREGDIVLEIGPGTGSLTDVLLDAGATILAIEKDSGMAALVEERFEGVDRLQILREDFTKCCFRPLIQKLLNTLQGSELKFAKVVSNIPFNISTEVLRKLLPMGDIIADVVLLLQDETALRLIDASLGSSEYRPMSIFVNFYSDPVYKFKVPRSNFFPQPNVDAAVAMFKLKHPSKYPAVSSTESFFSMINSAFSGKRKMLRKSLRYKSKSEEIEVALSSIGLPIHSRPGDLTIDDFVKLHHLISEK